MERRVVLACALPASEMMTSARVVRAKLLTTARTSPTLAADADLSGTRKGPVPDGREPSAGPRADRA